MALPKRKLIMPPPDWNSRITVEQAAEAAFFVYRRPGTDKPVLTKDRDEYLRRKKAYRAYKRKEAAAARAAKER